MDSPIEVCFVSLFLESIQISMGGNGCLSTFAGKDPPHPTGEGPWSGRHVRFAIQDRQLAVNGGIVAGVARFG